MRHSRFASHCQQRCGIAALGQSQTLQLYTNSNFGFELSYPAAYSVSDLPCYVARWAATFGYQSLLYVRKGESQNAASIQVTLDRRRFGLNNLRNLHSRVADQEPLMVKVGENTFYYYGRGGGGVAYPDEYFYNLEGNTLEISFDGPYPPNDNSPTAETKEMENKILKSFRRIKANKSE